MVPGGVWRQELRLIPKTGPYAGIFRGINPLIPLMLVENGLVYLSMPSILLFLLHVLQHLG
jgi:hypothetical protein